MNYLTPIIQILTGIGSVGVLIGFLVVWKTGLLSYILNLKKNGNGNGDAQKSLETTLAQFVQNLENNHLAHLKSDIKESINELREDIKEIRRDISEHVKEDARVQAEILIKLENYGK